MSLADYFWTPGSGASTYNLREVVAWSVDSDDDDYVLVRFTANMDVCVRFEKSAFEVAMQTVLDGL